MFNLSPPTSPRRALRALLFLASLVALTAVSVACGPARSGGSDECESDDDCGRNEYCRFKDPDDDEGECKSRNTGNNNTNNTPTNNNPQVTADCDAICDKFIECELSSEGDRSACVAACKGEGTISGPYQDCLLTSSCEDVLTCEQPVNNNTPVNNNPNNNNTPVNNNPGQFTLLDCENTCDRFLQCSVFEECSQELIEEGRDQCYRICFEDLGQIEAISQSTCDAITPLASNLVNIDQCGSSPCQDACDHIADCTAEFCPDAEFTGCVEFCESDPNTMAQFTAIGSSSCGEIEQLICP